MSVNLSVDNGIYLISFSVPPLRFVGAPIIGYPFFPISNKLEEFSNLSEGWHFGEGRGPSKEAVDFSRDASLFLLEIGIEDQNCFPGVFGEVRVTGYCNLGRLEITHENDNSISLFIENSAGETQVDRQNISIDDMKHDLRKFIGNNEWNMSDYSQTSIGIPSSMSSQVWPSRTPLMEAESL